MTRILDINPERQLVLVGDDDLGRIRYEPLTPDAAPEPGFALVYLKQAHYCARATAQGLVITSVEPLLPGWQRFDLAAQQNTR